MPQPLRDHPLPEPLLVDWRQQLIQWAPNNAFRRASPQALPNQASALVAFKSAGSNVNQTNSIEGRGSRALSSTLPSGTDLQITSATAPATASIGSTLNLSWTVTNNGAAPANSDWWDNVYLSKDSAYDFSDTYVTALSAADVSPLAAGASYTHNKTVSAPNVSAAGKYYLIFRTNIYSDQDETNDSNNNYAIPISIDLSGPDLQITSASAPASASIGTPLNLSWTVKNSGSKAADSEWWDAVYLSNDSTYDNNDTFVSPFFPKSFSPLAAGASYTINKVVSAPYVSTAGQYYLIFKTDFQFNPSQGEINETNNTYSVPIHIDLNGPDLQITSATAPSTTSVGSSLNLAWTVKNNGPGTAESDWWDGIYLSRDANYDYSDTFIGSFDVANISPLAAGASYTLNKTISAPNVSTTGQYYLIFKTDIYPSILQGEQGETNETNNSYAVPITIDSNGPDLQITSVTAPATASIGNTLNLSWTVKNNGSAAASGNWHDGIYLSNDLIYDYNDTFVGSANASPLAAGASYTLNTTVSAPNVGAAGQYYFIFKTDAYSDQGEVNEANNTYTTTISIDLNGPDLQITSAKAPTTASIGSSINLSWTVKNNGPAKANNDWWDGVYLSSDATYDYEDTYVTSLNKTDSSPLAPGTSYTLNKTVSVPYASKAGKHYLIFKTDAYSNQGETNEDNNTYVIPININLNGPDLQITSAKAPATASIGSSINLSWTVKNNGPTKANSDWWDDVYLSSDASHDINDTYVTNMSAANISPLPPGSSYTLNKAISVPNVNAAGKYYLIFNTDAYSNQGETNEGNNTIAIPIDLKVQAREITLEVSPSTGVNEDGTANLIYTFSRTGPTTSALTVNFTVGGTASPGTDYTGISATSPTKTVSFAAGSPTAKVIVNPKADTTIEPDESVALTLAEGTGYTIGTPAAVVATIRNDDVPRITLAATPSIGVSEDGSANLTYTFSRSGPTTSTLTVNFTVAGTASPGTDYNGIAATGSTKTVSFAVGSAQATVTVDPTADITKEPDETVILKLTSGTGYTLGTTAAVSGTIRNDDIIGTAANNILRGTAAADLIDGLAGADTLTGLAGADRFAFRFSQSPLTGPDRITDFAFASDTITLVSAAGSALPIPRSLSRAADNPTATTLRQLATSVFADANSALAGNQPLAANAAALVRSTNKAIAGTYLLINDNTAALSASNDLLINLTGYSGTLPAIGTIAANRVFV